MRPFGYTGEARTCLWCGRPLRRETVIDEDLEQKLRAEGATGQEAYEKALVPADRLGPYQDDSFDTRTCGYQFGVRMAELGRRLQLPEDIARKPVR